MPRPRAGVFVCGEQTARSRGPIAHRFQRASPMSPNPFAWPFRSQFLLGLLCCLGLLGYALYVQYQQFLEPCPLCIFQRVAFFAAAAVFLLRSEEHTSELQSRENLVCRRLL